MPVNPKLRFLYVAWAFLECVLFGGLLYGWGSLVFILIEEGVYSELCDGYIPPVSTTARSDHGVSGHTPLPVSTTEKSDHRDSILDSRDSTGDPAVEEGVHAAWRQNCPVRERRFALVFTVATVALCVGTAALGQLNFKYGTRLTRLCALVIFTAGALLTGFTSHDLPWLIFPGLSLVAVGGMPLLMTNTQFSNLFTRGSSTVVSLLSGAYDTSSGVPLILKLLHERGISLRWSMLVIASAHLLTMVSTFFFLPEGFIAKVAPEPVVLNVGRRNSEGLPNEHSDEDNAHEREPLLRSGKKEEQKESIKSCILSPMYCLHVLWMSILQLRFLFFIGSLNTWLNSLFHNTEDVSHYTNVCQFVMMFGLVCSFISGIVYDINKRIFDDSRSELRRKLMPAVMPQTLTALLGIVMSALVLRNAHSVLYPTFIVNVVFRSFMYSMAASYIGVMFPSEYFGVLYGLMIILSGSVGMAQYGLFAWSQASGYTTVNIFLIAFLTLSLVHPLYQWITCHRAESRSHCEDSVQNGKHL
ncbi:equilibrative nucleobase transporter 1-like [Babylonia areolata]|uniref:equilibrative nucleobase transporter 1-like n=1 Tax=Babylonia areolata TaxID=304850 RepID=UPI003FD02C9D